MTPAQLEPLYSYSPPLARTLYIKAQVMLAGYRKHLCFTSVLYVSVLGSGPCDFKPGSA